MSVLKYKTRGCESPRGIPKVYFCAHDDDISRYFEDISDELLKHQRCAVWYAEKGTPRDDDFWADLREMNLFVMPVTSETLSENNGSVKKEFQFAMTNHIPVLPLMQEQDLVAKFNEQFGKIQFLDKYDSDATALPYEEKLHKFLDAVLVGDELAQQIRQSFDAYLFLSYRKKDRKHAQKLMKLIHKNDFCRDVAIWYDEFLIPGEDFGENIQKALEKSDLFVLTITPNVLEYVKDEDGVLQKNYVVRVEFPEAHKVDKDMILPVQMVPTSKDELDTMFDRLLPECTDGTDTSSLTASLSEKLSQLPLGQKQGDVRHNYLMGLAYLYGVDMETDFETARILITSASDEGLCDATQKLVDMYSHGIGVTRSLKNAISWQKKLIKQRERIYRDNPTDETFHRLFWSIINCCDYCQDDETFGEAMNQLTEARKLCQERSSDDHATEILHNLSIVYERKGDLYRRTKHDPEAIKQYEECLKIRKTIAEAQDGDQYHRELGICYERIGDMYHRMNDFTNAISYFHEKLKLDKQKVASRGNIDDHTGLFYVRYKLARSYLSRAFTQESDKDEDLDQARDHCEEAIRLASSLTTGCDDRLYQFHLSSSYALMGKIFLNIGELRKYTGRDPENYYEEAEENAKRGLQIAQSFFDSSSRSLQSIQFLVTAYRRFGEIYHAKASVLSMMDHSDKKQIPAEDLLILKEDQQLLEQAKSYYSKAHNLAQSAYRNYGTLSTGNDLYQCYMDMGSVCHSMLMLPLEPKIRKMLQNKPRAYYDEALKIAQNLVRQRPSSGHREKVANVYGKLTVLEPENKNRYLPEAIKIYQQLVKEYPNMQQYQNQLMGYQAMLEGYGIIAL